MVDGSLINKLEGKNLQFSEDSPHMIVVVYYKILCYKMTLC